jgi:hypothetical protein
MHLAITEWILAAVLFGWGLISLLNQFRHPATAGIRRHDLFRLTPSWRLFAPVPARRDYHLEYRLMTSAAEVTHWQRVILSPERRTWRFLWNPKKRPRKAFYSAVKRITRGVRSGQTDVSNSMSYLQILHLLQHSELAGKSRRLQFRIISAQDYARDQKRRIVFISSWHARS